MRVTAIRLLAPLALASAAIPAPAVAAGGVRCVMTATPLSFGRFVPTRDMAADFTATITLTCSATGSSTASVEGTIALLGSGGARAMADGPRRLRYRLFVDAARTIPWGDGSGDGRAKPISALVGSATPLRTSLTVYGRILAGNRHAEVGNYSDQITAVLTY